jgi:hypothetical protein
MRGRRWQRSSEIGGPMDNFAADLVAMHFALGGARPISIVMLKATVK